MSDISSALKMSLSQIVDESVVRNLESFNLFDTALNNESLVTIQDAEDAASLDEKELLEIVSVLDAQLETASGDEKIAIEQAIIAITASLDSAEDVEAHDINEAQQVDIDGDGQTEQLGEYLNSPEQQQVILQQFQSLSHDTALQTDILKHYFNNNDFDFMRQLLATLSPDDAGHLIAEVAENE